MLETKTFSGCSQDAFRPHADEHHLFTLASAVRNHIDFCNLSNKHCIVFNCNNKVGPYHDFKSCALQHFCIRSRPTKTESWTNAWLSTVKRNNQANAWFAINFSTASTNLIYIISLTASMFTSSQQKQDSKNDN